MLQLRIDSRCRLSSFNSLVNYSTCTLCQKSTSRNQSSPYFSLILSVVNLYRFMYDLIVSAVRPTKTFLILYDDFQLNLFKPFGNPVIKYPPSLFLFYDFKSAVGLISAINISIIKFLKHMKNLQVN